MLHELVDTLPSWPTAIAIATSHDGRLALTRSMGCEIIATDLLRVPVASIRAARVLQAAIHGCPISVLITRVDDLRSVQIKGHVIDVSPATDADLDLAMTAWRRFAEHITRMTPERDLGNVVATADVTLTVRVTHVFDQTPGPGAGRLLGRQRHPRALGPRVEIPAPTHDELAPALALTVERAFDGSIPPLLVTLDSEGTPNAIHISKIDVIDDRHLALSRQFFRKTAENLAHNPEALIHVGDPLTNRMYLVEVRHLRVETSGPLFVRLSTEIEALAAMMGASNLFRLEAVDVFEVRSQSEILGFTQDARLTPG